MKVKSYRELRVWQQSVDFCVKVYKVTNLFPKEELYGLTSQIRRASVSIPSNIAEGQTRNTTGEFSQFLGISKGSLAEVNTQSEIAKRLGFLPNESFQLFENEIETIGKMLNALQNALPKK
ncbi:four helix bundle protein [Runella slithyformis]|uniref:S23 ribosomal protein n=1 Tax=Runella slithyformis (strain ATCC 29530 / DSM 19594 / LMG 11500 / NCIMB 11436 / LSU 4) TaxID=761193 RepID=A0A7U3ZNL6_RUNSL|nr:four helix bundle protein [Runella slithyformis]AEI50524.1 S23 ribosomal protein [Runella slithyformis DSM 19594]